MWTTHNCFSSCGDALTPETPQNPQKISFSSDVIIPPRVAGRAKIDALLENLTPQAIAALSDLLPCLESTALRSYLGHRIAEVCRPELAALIAQGLRMKSVHFLEGCLSKLAAREYESFVQKQPPVLDGECYAEVRRLLAEVCCEPYYMVGDDAWEKNERDVLALSAFPLTILRRCGGPEVADVAITAFTRGGIGAFMNRKALDLLKLYEGRSPKRLLTEGQVLSVATVFDENLRDASIQASLTSFVDMWLSKEPDVLAPSIRDLLLYEVEGLTRHAALDFELELPKLLDSLTLLRHFKDDDVHRLMQSAVNLGDPTISPVALLCLRDAKVSSLRRLVELVSGETDDTVRYRALRVFGQSISPIADRLTFPILEEYLRYTDDLLRSEPTSTGRIIRERELLLEGACRRFFSEPLDSPFMSSLFKAAVDTSETRGPTRVFAVNVFGQIAQTRRLPPVWLYDDFERIQDLQTIANHLEKRLQGVQFPDHSSPADQMRSLFFSSGPSHYGFEIEFS